MSTFNRPVIVYGAQGCGKTRHAQRLARVLDCRYVVDDWDGDWLLPPGALALTSEPEFSRRCDQLNNVVDFWQAMGLQDEHTPGEQLVPHWPVEVWRTIFQLLESRQPQLNLYELASAAVRMAHR